MVKRTRTQSTPQISVIAEGKDEWESRYFLLGTEDEPLPDLPPVPVGRFFKDKQGILADLANAGYGLFTPAAQRAFFDKAQAWGNEPPSFRVASRIGWNGSTYVLPDKTFALPRRSSNGKRKVYPLFGELDSKTIAKYRAADKSLEDWQEKIGKLCLNNSRLMFAVALAFTGPILHFVKGERSGGFQIHGHSERGKTTAAMVAGSVWGCRRDYPDLGFLESWNTTANAVELTALAHNDGLLILDETRKAGKTYAKLVEAVKEVTMRLAERQAKRRKRRAQIRTRNKRQATKKST